MNIKNVPKCFSHPVLLGEGSFSSVFRVKEPELDRMSVLKIINNRRLSRKIQDEARTHAQVSASCIPRLQRVMLSHGRACLLMEWIKGVPLSDVLDVADDIERNAISIGIISSLADLHSIKIAHRDLKPANILITPNRGVVLIDLGFAQIDRGMTSGKAMGTPRYMAPEIIRGVQGSDYFRADIFSLGRILNELTGNITGSEMHGITERCLAEDPSLRFSDATEVVSAFQSRNNQPVTIPAMANDWANAFLVERLCCSARRLLDAGRSTEAYWLLVETLDIAPDNADAIGIMTDFNRRTALLRRKRRRIPFIVAGGLLATISAIFIFFAGRETGKAGLNFDEYAINLLASRVLIRNDMPKVTGLQSVPFIKNGISDNNLNGRLLIAGVDSGSTVLIDGDTATASVFIPSGAGIDLQSGNHEAVLVNASGKRIASQHFRLLPFENKTISFVLSGKE